MTATLTIVRKEQSIPENYAHFFLTTPRTKNPFRIVLCDGGAITCERHRKATSDQPCECMKIANADPDKNQYWSPYVDNRGSATEAATSRKVAGF
jgi:hypothetical protein